MAAVLWHQGRPASSCSSSGTHENATKTSLSAITQTSSCGDPLPMQFVHYARRPYTEESHVFCSLCLEGLKTRFLSRCSAEFRSNITLVEDGLVKYSLRERRHRIQENDDLPLSKRLRSTVSSISTCKGTVTKNMPKSFSSTPADISSCQVLRDGGTMSHSTCHYSQNCGQHSGKASSDNCSLNKGRSRAKSLTVPRRSLRLSSSSICTHNSVAHHNSSGAKPIDLDDSRYRSKEVVHTQSEGRKKSRKIVTVPLTNVLLNGCNYIANSSHQNDAKEAQLIKSRNDDQQDCDSIMTCSQAKSNDIQTIHISPMKARPSLLTAECKCKTSRTVQLRSDSQIYISPMYTPDLLSPTSSGKLDISIECHSRKSLSDLELCSTTGSKSKQEPEVITSNNVVVALTVTEDEQVGGMSGQIHRPTPKLDHVACITIETGSQSEEQSRAPVEISIRPDLFNNLHSFGPSDQ